MGEYASIHTVLFKSYTSYSREHVVSVFSALRTLAESRGLTSDSTCALEAKPGKFDIKRRDSGILFIRLQLFYSSNKPL